MTTDNQTLLTQSGPIYRPMLAAYVGINEALFLSQLDYILDNRTTNIKEVDGRKWYKASAHYFAVNEFIGWGEAKVKRTINNLRNDGLILARSDLNDDGTRALWYTLNKADVNALTGPVHRIAKKSERLQEASLSRRRYQEVDDYTTTKDHNDLIPDSKAEDQNDPTEPMEAKDHNDLITQDHNDPIYKESFKNRYINNKNKKRTHVREELDPKWEEFVGIYEDHFGLFSSTQVDDLKDYCDRVKIPWFREACKRCYDQGVIRWSYCKPILDSFIAAGRITEQPKNGAHDAKNQTRQSQRTRSAKGQQGNDAKRPARGTGQNPAAIAAAFRSKARANSSGT